MRRCAAARAREVQRALAGMIAGEKERPALRVPAGEGEAADQVIERCRKFQRVHAAAKTSSSDAVSGRPSSASRSS